MVNYQKTEEAFKAAPQKSDGTWDILIDNPWGTGLSFFND
jgi:hypothetical protein